MSDAITSSLARLAPALSRVAGPGQYVGGEPNQIVKPDARLRLALAFADVYAVGMSHHGLRILYEVANAMDGVAAERVFAPFPDMEAALRDRGLPLTTLETATPLADCQVVGFSLCYELAATSVLTMLDLGGIPLTRFQRERSAAPLVIAGGAASLNPEPLSDFIDIFCIGEGEEALPELLAIVAMALPITADNRAAVIRAIARAVPGSYAPALYQTATSSGGDTVVTAPLVPEAPLPVRRRVVADLNAVPQVTRPVVPIHETVHERAVLEIMRGCPNGCRFCQAGYTTRPLRERDPETLRAAAHACLAATGYDEVGLLSLSTSNYSAFDSLVGLLDGELAPAGVSLSLPSLRVDHALSGIPARFASVRKSGLTVAPEAGSDRLRRVINKHVTNDDLLAAAEEAFRRNWRQIKLYFMIGLPTETEADVVAIADLADAVARRRSGKGGGRPAVHLSASNFVPKPYTAFQWCGAAHPDIWAERQRLLAARVNRKRVAYHGHDVSTSLLEAVIARGDRRLGKVILSAWRKGARLDAWSEHFRPGLWNEAFQEHGLDPIAIATREIAVDAILPWDHIDSGVSKDFLERELETARREMHTPACAPGHCAGCGIAGCSFPAGTAG
ncbi:MAG: TIGR03960 family B12-binding radical SAM protein [Planctomycetes bacterium]|nr:TIGR03960 family B12-binding radical SAM protein [Planctomycetota bacterium]